MSQQSKYHRLHPQQAREAFKKLQKAFGDAPSGIEVETIYKQYLKE